MAPPPMYLAPPNSLCQIGLTVSKALSKSIKTPQANVLLSSFSRIPSTILKKSKGFACVGGKYDRLNMADCPILSY